MSINKILTDADRTVLQPAILEMQKFCPGLFQRKISGSMVQFAFCYVALLTEFAKDTPEDIDILCAGSYEDIVSESLKSWGFNVTEIDPVINLDLHTYYTKHFRQFDAVLCASVLEHVANDEEFVAECCDMLKDGGLGVFVMDFKDSYKPGQRLPTTDVRFFTTYDLTERLANVLAEHDCILINPPNYTAVDTFSWEGINYSFATWVFRKVGK